MPDGFEKPHRVRPRSPDAGIWQQVGELFDKLVDQSPDTRLHHLERIESQRVHDWVERLLAAHDSDGDSIVDETLDELVERIVRMEGDRFSVMPESVSDLVLGNWRTIEEIGRGGMGVVLRGERADGQFEKEVAIKLLPPGPVGPERQQRFADEIRALARLEHPNIAHLIDGGISDDDIPYLVMEYVDGIPITDYCNRHRLDLIGRIELFDQVIAAVSFSHRQLIIHGDIKPSNLLVTLEGRVKLVDFGVASMLTEPASMRELPAGVHCSPAYSAPERLQGAPPAIPQDIYALGAVLNELLTGHKIRNARQMTALLMGHPPAKPPLLPSEQAADNPYAPFPASRLKGDLDAICERSLADHPDDRYESASALKTDLENWNDHRPVQATNGGKIYRTGKWFRRHKLPAAAVVLVTVSLVAGTGISLWQADRAAKSAEEAEHQMRRALAAQRDAEQAQARAVATRDFLVDLFQATIPDVPADQLPDTESLLVEGARRALEAEALSPALRADMLSAIGSIYRIRGRHEEARPLLEQARKLATETRQAAPEIHARTAIAWANLLLHDEKVDEAFSELEQLITILEASAPESPMLLEARYELGLKLGLYLREDRKALAIMQEVNREVHGRDDVADRFRRRLKTGLAHTLFGVGRFEEADPIYREAIELEEKMKGSSHRSVATKLANAANNDTMLGRFDRANARYRRALQIHHEAGEEPYEPHAAAHLGYGSSLAWQGRIDEALAQKRLGIRKWAEYDELDSPQDLRYGSYHVGYALMHGGRWEEAEAFLKRAIDNYPEEGGARLILINALTGLTLSKCKAGDTTSGLKYLDQLHTEKRGRDLLPTMDANILEAEAECLRASGAREEALDTLAEAASLASAMAPGAAAFRARRSLLQARIHAKNGEMSHARTALDAARRELGRFGLDTHPLMSEISDLQERLGQQIAGHERSE